MGARRRTWFDSAGLSIDGAPLPFYAGAMHYWRVPPAAWVDALGAIRKLGLTIVETYVPWREHEEAPGRFDWRGEKDLARFIGLARDAGLAVVLRPGPAVNAELTSFGFPDHVLADETSQARTARGTPVWLPSPPRAWPVPSYASQAFQAHVRRWYAAFAEVVRPHLAPEGPVVAIGVDNEAMRFFRGGAFDHDYHPDALAAFREATGLEAPRAWDANDASRCAAWVRFGEQALARALGDFSRLMDEVGLDGVARFHNLPAGHLAQTNVAAIQAAIGGPVGLDAYTRRGSFAMLGRAGAFLAGSAPVPIAFEVGIGYAPWFPPLDASPKDTTRERDHLLRLLAAGIRGFNLFMTVERDRFYGAAISSHGDREKHAAWIPTLVSTLDAIDWPSLRPLAPPPIAVIATRADARMGLASSVLDPIAPLVGDILGFGPGGSAELGLDAAAIAARKWHDAVAAALELARIPYVILDEDAPAEQLAAYRALVIPTPGRIDRALWQRLASLPPPAGSASGPVSATPGPVIVLGPEKPTRDELDAPLDLPGPRRFGRLRPESLTDLAGLASDLAALAGALPDTWTITPASSPIRSIAYADGNGTVQAVFVVNDSDRAAAATLVTGAHVGTLKDPFAETIEVIGGHASFNVPPHSVRLLVANDR